jgi:acyl carrier protein
MTNDEIKATLLDILGGIAPEADRATIKPDVDLRDQLDIDSMDFLNFVIGIDERLGVAIDESDYAELVTIDDIAAYVGQRLTAVQA